MFTRHNEHGINMSTGVPCMVLLDFVFLCNYKKKYMLSALSFTSSIEVKANYECDETFPSFPGSIVPSILKLELADMETAARDCTTNQPSAR